MPGVLPGTLSADLRSTGRAALARVQNRSAHGCGWAGPALRGAASGRFCRTPDRSVRSPAGKMVSFYKSTTCGLDQPQNVVISSVNEPYLVLCWYIIATYASQQAKSTKANARELAVSGRNVPFSASRYALLSVSTGDNRRSELSFQGRKSAHGPCNLKVRVDRLSSPPKADTQGKQQSPSYFLISAVYLSFSLQEK